MTTMKADDIEVGGTYIITHHGERDVEVTVVGKHRTSGNFGPRMIRYDCVKVRTGKPIAVKSAVKFQRKVAIN